MRLALIFSSLLLFFMACDKIEGPYATKPGNTPTDTSTLDIPIRKVLIEDFTGHSCGNCPRAAEALNAIASLYPKEVVAVAVHVGFFASADPVGYYTADYKSQVGNELDQTFGNAAAGLPNGLINRKSFDGNSILQHAAWASKTTELLASPPDLWIKNQLDYNPSSRSLSINTTTKVLNNIDAPLNIVHYITEDSIQSPQKDYSHPDGKIIDYYHRHMLRGSANGTWGIPLGNGVYTSNSEITSNAQITIPSNWFDKKCAVVTIIYNTLTKEVIQADEKKIPVN